MPSPSRHAAVDHGERKGSEEPDDGQDRPPRERLLESDDASRRKEATPRRTR
jgi:hypothetical protein